MSNPAIVLMTDPSRCSLGDVHYLLQALREMQQMGEHAAPQAFCDHPAAAEGFIAAYAHAYPKLVLQDGGIPTPDHLQSLMANGQMGAFGQPLEWAAPGGPAAPGSPSPPTELAGSNGFPIVVLTLGASQVLADAMQQSPAMKDSIRLIDIVPDGVDSLPVSIAEAIGGLDGEGAWQAEGLGAERPELDEVAGASITDSGGLALDDDTMDLDVVETADASGGGAAGYHAEREEEPAAVEPLTTDQSEFGVTAETVVESAAPEEAYEASPAAESVAELADAIWSGNDELAEANEFADGSDDLAVELEDDATDGGDVGERGDGETQEKDGEPKDPEGEDTTDMVVVLERGVLGDDDVDYPPVGDLIVGADVPYPALDQAAAQGVLQELAGVMLDDAIFDPDLASGSSPAGQDDLSLTLHEDKVATIRSTDKGATVEDLYGSLDEEIQDVFADTSAARPSHDTDL